jgi:ATP-grasp domain
MSCEDVLLVVYDYGSLAPMRLKSIAADNGCKLAYLIADSAHARDMRPVLEMTGTVIDMAGRTETDLLWSLTALRLAGIVTFSEYQIQRTAALASALDLPYHSPADVAAITRKDAQRRRLAQCGIDALRWRVISAVREIGEAVRHVGLPLVVKPVRGTSSRSTFAVTDGASAEATIAGALRAGGDYDPPETSLMLEEFIPGRHTEEPWGDYIAVECAVSGNQVWPAFVTSKFAVAPPFRERGGYGWRSVEPEAELVAIQALACQAVAALNITSGVADVEIKLTDAGPRLIEVNGRLGGLADDLAIHSGCTSPGDIAVKAALNRPFQIVEPAGQQPIAFHYRLIPPVTARAVRSVQDLSRLRQLEFVDTVKLLAQPGTPVGWARGTPSAVASITGATQTHDQLAQLIAQIEDCARISYC